MAFTRFSGGKVYGLLKLFSTGPNFIGLFKHQKKVDKHSVYMLQNKGYQPKYHLTVHEIFVSGILLIFAKHVETC